MKRFWRHSRKLLILMVLGVTGCWKSGETPKSSSSAANAPQPSSADLAQTIENAPNKIKVKSLAFGEGEAIASQQAHTNCGGQNVSPVLTWSGVPPLAKSVAIVVSDPDAPSGAWTHWIIYNLPPGRKNVPQGIATGEVVPGGAQQAKNDWGVPGYGGPCPPNGKHHYKFYVVALDTKLALPAEAGQAEFGKAIVGHVMARGVTTGTYTK